MSNMHNLPTKDDFLNNLETFEHCDICQEAFDEVHVPTRTKCNHLFGATCLKKWIDSDEDQSHACPMCREPMFTKPVPPLSFLPGTRPADHSGAWWLETVDLEKAQLFVKALWDMIKRQVQAEDDRVYESDVEIYINLALWVTAREHPHEHYGDGLYIKAEHWSAVKEVAKDMFLKHHQDHHGGRSSSLDAAELAIWYSKMAEAVGWRVV